MLEKVCMFQIVFRSTILPGRGILWGAGLQGKRWHSPQSHDSSAWAEVWQHNTEKFKFEIFHEKYVRSQIQNNHGGFPSIKGWGSHDQRDLSKVSAGSLVSSASHRDDWCGARTRSWQKHHHHLNLSEMNWSVKNVPAWVNHRIPMK